MTEPGQRRTSGRRDTGARDRLLATTVALVADGGSASATSRAIAAGAGENLAAITYYFGSKDALVRTALVRHARDLIEPVLDELTSDRAQIDKLLRALQLLTDLFGARRRDLPGYVECLAHAAHDDAVASELRDLFARLQHQLAGEMAVQRDAGLIPDWVDPVAMAALIVGLANGVAVQAVVDPERSDPAAIARQFVALLLAVAATPAPPSA